MAIVDASAVVIVVGGALVTPFGRVASMRIDDVLNDAPNTASFTIVHTTRTGPITSGAFDAGGFDATAFLVATYAPVLAPPPIEPGAPVQIYLGAADPAYQIFGGQIATREQVHEFDQPRHVRYYVSCIDFTRRLNYRKILKDYGQQSATAIVVDVIARYAPAITAAHVQAGLPTVTGGITFTFEEVSRALSRVAEKIGAYWYVDYAGDLHFWKGAEAGTEPAPIVPGGDFANLKITADLTQVRTRVIVEGDGATVLLTLPAGDAILPVSQSIPFNPAGGRAKLQSTMITYTGTHPGGVKTNTVGVGTGGTPPPAAPGPPTLALAPAGTKGSLGPGPYYYAVTFELGDGSRSALGTPAGPIAIPVLGAPATDALRADLNNYVSPGPKKGPVAVDVESRYGVTFVSGTGQETGLATSVLAVVTGRHVNNQMSYVPLSTAVGTALPVGYTFYTATFYTPTGETIPYRQDWTRCDSGMIDQRCQLPIAADARVIGRRIYRSATVPTGAVPTSPWYKVVDIPNNTAIEYWDRTPVANLPQVQLPQYDSAIDVGEGTTVTVPTSPDPRVVRRRLYRKDDGGDYRLIAELPDNVTTTYNDILVGAGGALAPMAGTITDGAVNVTNIPIGPAGTVKRRIFRTKSGGTEYRELTAITNNTATTYLDTESDNTLGGSPLPAQGGAGAAAPPAAAGSTQLQVASLDYFPMPGWAVVESVMIRYTGYSTAGGLFLTGIPASGPGAITADIPAGTIITTSPALVGVAPVVPVAIGDAVQLIVQVDDVPAQTALAAIEGGDGIIEHYIQDRRLSEAGAVARAQAELALFKTIETRVSYTTHDPNTRSGRTVSFALPSPTSLSGEFLIQRVTIDDVSIAKDWYPRRAVDASTTRFSFDDVLNRLLMEST